MLDSKLQATNNSRYLNHVGGIERKEIVDLAALETIFLPMPAYHWRIDGICLSFLFKSDRFRNFCYFYIFCFFYILLDQIDKPPMHITVLFKLPTKIQHHPGFCFDKIRLCSR